ncbi:MAG TPA: hypothetical protein VMF14_06950 [Solirubrobacteraceae bacterium]|nr:hypothetical protein [Solirubrobacteraceae bacterium]
MHLVKYGQQLVVTITAVALLTGAAAARADGPRAGVSGGASLTGLVPSAPEIPTAAGATVVPATTVPAVSPVPVTAPPADPTAASNAPPSASATPISPVSTPISPSDPAPTADPGPSAAPEAPPATSPPPATVNTTTQTITQVQVSSCVSHCSGGTQVQQASQSNATDQAVGPPVPSDGGAALAAPAATPSPQPGVTQVQVGCVAHCYDHSTHDHSGLTPAQIQQLVGQVLQPSPPVVTAAPGDEQNVTQQASAQSQTGDGRQTQAASQSNGTVEVAPAPDGSDGTPDGTAPDGTASDGAGAAPAATNQTAQGVVQLQVGCVFYCSDTRQTQQAQQSTTTVQSVNSGGAGATNTVSQGVLQVQVGCVAWCYDTVETQTAGASNSTVVTVAPAPPAPVAAPGEDAASPGASPRAAEGPAVTPPRGRARVSGGAGVRVTGAGELVSRGARLTEEVASVSAVEQVGGGKMLTSVATSRSLQTQSGRQARRGSDRRGVAPDTHTAPPVVAPTVAAGSTAQATIELFVALVAVLTLTMGFAVRRRRAVG